MPTRKAHARWQGTIKEGTGTLDFGNGAFKGAYSFGSRFAQGAGTNPEELLGAAQTAKANCPVSRALAGTAISLEATLAGG